MTDDMMNLRTLLEKSSDADLLREMIGFTRRCGGPKTGPRLISRKFRRVPDDDRPRVGENAATDRGDGSRV